MSWNWKDQGWGNQKGQVELKLCKFVLDTEYPVSNEWSENGSGVFENTVERWQSGLAPHDLTNFTISLTEHPIVLEHRAG